jgi:hypothetical protein
MYFTELKAYDENIVGFFITQIRDPTGIISFVSLD